MRFVFARTIYILILMLRINRSVFYLSQIFVSQATQKTIQLFDTTPSQEMPSLLNFQNKTTKKVFLTTLFSSKTHSSLFQLYLNFIQRRQQAPSDMAFQFIEENLRKKALSELKNKKAMIKVNKYRMLSSRLLEKKQITGVFVHRKYNLHQDNYSIELKQPEIITCELKSIMRSEALALQQKIVRAYEKDKMKDVYGCQLKEFKNQKLIIRYFYQVESQLQLELSSPKGVQKMGHENPTKHLLQVQSHFNAVSNLQQFYLTDVDYFLKGNSYFR